MAKTERVHTAVMVEGLTEARRAFDQYGKAIAPAMRDVAQEATARFTPALQAAMRGDSPQSALVAVTVRPVRDRVPAIAVGGSRKVRPSGPKRKAPPQAGDVFFGAEFGGRGRPSTQQFRPHRGRRGYGFYPELRDRTDDLIRAYYDGLDRLALEWEH